MTEFKGKSYSIKDNEEEIVKFWNHNNIFQKSIDQNKKNEQFILHEGPPFASGSIHYGHLLGSFIKDTICRWKTLNGFYVPRHATWDTHGLPIEYAIEQKLGIKTKQEILKFGIDNYNEECRGIVMSCADSWKSEMNRYGRWLDFDNNAKTMDIEYMSNVWNVFYRIYEKGLIYEGVKIMPYSVACTTPLSNFEASSNYQNVSDRTIVVKFPIKNKLNEFFTTWTTTPWTLPSHYCLCVNSDLTYVVVENDAEKYYVCKTRIQFLEEKLKTKLKIINECKGKDLIGIEYEPMYNFGKLESYRIVSDNFVTDDSGTGIVHIAPAFGADDYRVSLEKELITKELSSLYMHIDDSGNGINCDQFNNMTIKQMTNAIIKNLKERNNILFEFDYNHSYPFCWRSDTPLIYKAVKCWFLNVKAIQSQMVELSKTINWIPGYIDERFKSWLENTCDWCLSRNRYWGTPIPIWRSDDGDIIVIKSREHLEELTNQKVNDIHRHFIDQLEINVNGKIYKRIFEVFDCWFESGSLPYASKYAFSTGCDFVAEGLDQVTRGWFYVMHVIGTVLENKTPLKNVIVNGLVLAADGKKMSKRLKNYPDPQVIVDQYGADALRYYLIMSGASMAADLRFKDIEVKEILQTVIIPLTNTFSFYEEYFKLFCKTNLFTDIESDIPFDKWILKRTYDFISQLSKSLNEYKINPISSMITSYIEDLNNGYIHMNRDILKGKEDDIKCMKSLSTLKKVLSILSVYLSPILPFFCEKLHKSLGNEGESIHLKSINDIEVNKYNLDDNNQDIIMIKNLLNIIDMIRKIRSENKIQLKKPLKNIQIFADEDCIELLKKIEIYILTEGNILEIEYKKWEATKYEYKYDINLKIAGKLFREKRKDFELFMSQLEQSKLEKLYYGEDIIFESNKINNELINVYQVIPDNESSNIKVKEDIINKIKIKLNIEMDNNTFELFIAKNIATTFQRMRKIGNFHVYDDLRLLMINNEYSYIILKHMEYIMKTTNVLIELINNRLDNYDFNKKSDINEIECNMYLIKN